MAHREQEAVGTYLPGPAPPANERLEPLLRAWQDSTSLRLSPYPFEPPEQETLFRRVAKNLSIDELIELTRQESRTLRVRIIEHLMARAPERIDSLYLLLEDDRNLWLGRGCMVWFERVGTLVLQHAASLASASSPEAGRSASELRAVGRTFIELAADDASLPPFVRAAAIQTMSSFSAVSVSLVRDSLASGAPPLLVTALNLRTKLPEHEREQTVRGLLDHPSAWVRHESFSAASAMGLAGLGSVRRQMMISDPDEDCRALAAGAFASRCRRANPDLIALSRDRSWRIRQIALERLVQIDPEAALDAFAHDLSRSERDCATAMLCAKVLGRGDDLADRLALLSLGHDAACHHGIIDRALRYVTERPLPAGLEGARRHAPSDDPRVRAATAKALGRLGNERDIATLEALLDDHDCAVQDSAASALVALGSTSSVPRLRASLPKDTPRGQKAIEQAIEQLEARLRSS